MKKTTKTRTRRLLFVVESSDGDAWKAADVEDEQDRLRDQIRSEMEKGVPVVCVPAGLRLWTIEFEDAEVETEKEQETSRSKETDV